MFLELMAVPGSFEATHAFFGERVKASDVVVHNAHEAYDFNAADRNRRETNRQMLDESRRFADELNASVIMPATVSAEQGRRKRFISSGILTTAGLRLKTCR